MVYAGSKKRLAKYIIPILLKNRSTDQYYVEPFVGGANIIQLVEGKRIAADICADLINLYISLQNNWMPPENFSKEEFDYLADKNNNYKYLLNAPLKGYAKYICSFNSMGFSKGYCGKNNKDQRDRIKEKTKSLLFEIERLKGINFYHASYRDCPIPKNSIVYCDPPYQGTFNYNMHFDHSDFWTWAKEISFQNSVYVSELSAPSEWECIWSKEITHMRGTKKTEKLFKLRETL